MTTEALDTYYGTLRDKGLAPRTVLRVHAVVRRALGQGVRWGWLPANPALLASPGRLGSTEVEAPALTAIEAVLAEAKRTDPDLHAVVWLTAATGARRGEVCGLQWSDIDFDRQMLTIRRAVSDAGGKKVVGNTKTHQSRSLALDAISVELLRTMRLRAAERLLACGEPLQDNAYVYAVDVAGLDPMAPSVLSHRFSRLCKRAGVRMGLHGLRHAAATLLIASGTDVRTVSKRLGHADPSMTLRVYAHALQAQDRQAAETLGNMLGGAVR